MTVDNAQWLREEAYRTGNSRLMQCADDIDSARSKLYKSIQIEHRPEQGYPWLLKFKGGEVVGSTFTDALERMAGLAEGYKPEWLDQERSAYKMGPPT